MSISASQRVRLGLFMTVGLVLLALFITVPIGFKLTHRQKKFYAYFEGESLSGLDKGSIVKFYGMQIGKVENISYDPRNILRVKVDITIEEDFPLKNDMVIQTGEIAITGLKYLDILGGTNEAPLLKPGSEIKSKPSMMATITGKAEVIISKIELLLNHLNSITDPDSLAGIKTIVNNVASITSDANEFFGVIRPDIEITARSIQNIVERIDSISMHVNLIASETSRSVSEGRLGVILQSADSAAQSIQAVSEDLSLIVKQSREDIMVSMENLREALENANELTKILVENPSLLIRGEQQKERDIR